MKIGIGIGIDKLQQLDTGGGGNVAPSNVTAPVISGSTSLGSVLSTTNGTWNGTPATFSYTYQWKRNGSPIGGATASTYTTVVADSTANITCDVTADNGVAPTATAGSNTLTMANYAPVISVNPVISGSTSLGSTLTTTNGTWTNSPSTFTYQWFRGASPISGATNSTYVTVLADSTASITCQVTASNGLTSSPATSNALVMSNYTPANTVSPAVTGTAVVGQTLSTTNGTWTNSPSTFSYQWYRGATLISGATNSTYTLVQADAGNTSNIKCIVTASNGLSASADSNTVAQVLDADANAFFTAMALTDATIIAAENNFFISRKNVAALSNAIASYHMVTDKLPNTDRLAQFKFNAYSPIDADANKRLTYSGTLTANTTGLQGGANGFANTFINPSLSFTTNDFTLIYIIRTNSTANQIDLGAFVSPGGLQVITKFGDSNTYISPLGTDTSVGNIISNTIGIYFLKRSGNSVTLKRNNVTIYSNTIASSNKPNINTYLLARNNNGTAQVFSQREYSFFEFINGALTAQQETDFYNALVTRETALGR